MIRNFLFHRVNPQRDRLWDPMDTKLFEKCLKFISKNYEVVLLEDLVLNKIPKPKKSLATISFDDGYKDNIEYALPLLNKYNCKASFYVVTKCIEENVPTWTHILDYRFQYTSKTAIDFDFDFLPQKLKANFLPTIEERITCVKKLKPFLKTLPHIQRNLVLERVNETFSDVQIPKLMMTWDDLQELKNQGNYIGSHTDTHSMLGTINDKNEIRRELKNSAELIHSHLGHYPITISYPVGSYNEETMRISKEIGYLIGVAVKQTVYNPLKNGNYEIPRIELYNEPFLKVVLRITNILEKLKKVIKNR